MGISKSKKYYSSKQENMIANKLGWRVVTGSGARSTHPGDVESDEWLGECKTHESLGHKIVFYQSVWKKISDEASSKYKFPALFVDDGSQISSNTWVMFSTLPAVPYIGSNFIYTIKNNIRFDSLDMMKNRKELDLSTPVIFKISKDKRTLFISSLDDFALMFKVR